MGCFHCLGVLFLQVEWSCPPALYEVQRASVPHDGRLVPDTFKASCKVSRPALGRVVCKKGLQDLANVYMRPVLDGWSGLPWCIWASLQLASLDPDVPVYRAAEVFSCWPSPSRFINRCSLRQWPYGLDSSSSIDRVAIRHLLGSQAV